ncbi:MAG TPA: MlaD family protein [Steroidobacteraceae bacterium]|nr:MlaD family protein [Steroidobacteraceae bacterium]
MDRDAKYAAVGAFVLLLAGLGTWFVLWYSDSTDRHDYRRYEIYFQGSVTGLNEGQTVRYLGVVVGRVADIRLDPRVSNRVQVIADIDSHAPVDEHTLASLSLQGVTGLLYIDLAQDRGDRPVMPPVPGEHYPVIRSVQSDFDIFVSNLPELVTQASEVANRLNALLNDKNIAALGTTIDNLKRASDALPGTVANVGELVAEMRATVQEIDAAAAGVHGVTEGVGPDLKLAITHVREVAEHLATTSANLDRFMAENKDNITRFTDQGLLELQQLIRDSHQAAVEFRELSRSIKQNPSQLIYEPASRGVEIAR